MKQEDTMSTRRKITARYASRCALCEKQILVGDIAFWSPDDKSMICAPCRGPMMDVKKFPYVLG